MADDLNATRREAGPVPQRGVRQGEAARDCAPGRRQDGRWPRDLQEAAAGPPEGDEGAGEGARAADQAARRQGRGGEPARPRRRVGGRRARRRSPPRKAAAAAKAPVHALRGTGEAEKLLKNAKTQLMHEQEEIGNYLAIETLAEALRDTRHGQARARVPPPGGAHGRLPVEADPDADQGRRDRGGARLTASRRLEQRVDALARGQAGQARKASGEGASAKKPAKSRATTRTAKPAKRAAKRAAKPAKARAKARPAKRAPRRGRPSAPPLADRNAGSPRRRAGVSARPGTPAGRRPPAGGRRPAAARTPSRCRPGRRRAR